MTLAGDIVFVLCSIFAVAAALSTVLAKSAIRAAMGLLAHIISLAALYLTLHAHLLAALQLIVYAGAVVVLFIFVIMLIGPTPSTPTESKSLVTRVLAGALMVMVTTVLVASVSDVTMTRPEIAACSGTDCQQFGGVEAFGNILYKQAALPFELVSILLLVAILGAIAVGRGRSKEEVEHLRLKKQKSQDETVSAPAGAPAE